MIKKIFLSIIVMFIITHQTFSQDSLLISIDEAIIVSHNNNPLIKQIENQKKEKEYNLKASKGHYFPKLSLGANYQYLSKDITLDLNPLKKAINPLYETMGTYGNFSGVPNPDPQTNPVIPILPDDISTDIVRQKLLEGLETINNQDWERVIQEKNFGAVTANAIWPVFTGGKIKAGHKAAEIEYEEAKNEMIINKIALSKELIERYYGLRLSDKVIGIRKEVLDVMKMHLNNAQRMFDEGIIAESEYLHAKVYHAEAEREFHKAQREYKIVEKALKNTLALEDNTPVKPISKLFITESILPLSEYKSEAKQNNPMLKKIDLKKELSIQNVAVKKSDYFPTVALMGVYNIYGYNLSEQTPDWLAGINLTWNILDGFARTNKLKSAQYKSLQVDYIYEKAENDINTLIEKLYQQLNMDIDEMSELDTSEKYAQSYLEVTQKSFKEGIATSTEVTEASIALSKVQIDRLKVMYNYVKTLSQLLEATGNMDKFSDYQNNTNTIFEK